jgi:hypothetical protein
MNEATKACPNCGNTAGLNAKFCGQCGQNLVEPERDAKATELDVWVSPPPASEIAGDPKQTHFGVPQLDPAEARRLYELGIGRDAERASAAAPAPSAGDRTKAATPPTPFVDRDAPSATPPTPFVDRDASEAVPPPTAGPSSAPPPPAATAPSSAPPPPAASASSSTPPPPAGAAPAASGTPPTPFVDRDEPVARPIHRESPTERDPLTPTAAETPAGTPSATPPTPFVDRDAPSAPAEAAERAAEPSEAEDGAPGEPGDSSAAALDRAAESVPPPYAISSSAPPGEPTTLDDLPRRRVPKGRGRNKFAYTDMGIGKPDAAGAAGAKAASDAAPKETSKDSAPRAGTNPRGPAEPSKRTILGMPEKPIENAPAPAKEPARTSLPSSDRTMLGMPAVTRPRSVTPTETPAAKAAIAPQRTMLGMGQPPRNEPLPPRRRVAVEYHDASPEFGTSGEYEPIPKRPSRALPIAALVIATLLLLSAGAAIAYFAVGDDAPEVRASVVSSGGNETLLVEVPGAEDGTRVRFSGQEAPTRAGRAELALAPDALRIGENRFTIDVVAPDRGSRSIDVTLRVSFRIRADLAGVSADPPVARVLVDAPGAREAMLDGQTVALDSNGSAAHEVRLEAGTSVFEKNVPYRIAIPDEPPAEGTLRIRVPMATLQLDRPGRDVVTDRESIEIAGAVHSNARVSIDGVSVPVTEGRFVHRMALPETRTYEPRIVATEEGKAPHALAIRIRRVADLVAEARSFRADPELDYARLQTNPAIYRGQNIAIEGRVYNVTVSEGRTVLQMLARDCPSGQRCPLWVTYPAATDITADQWVRVLGTVAGEQQFRSESNRVLTVPRVDAVFVLPSDDRRRR